MVIKSISKYIEKYIDRLRAVVEGTPKHVSSLCTFDIASDLVGIIVEIRGDESCFSKLLSDRLRLLDRKICGIFLLYRPVKNSYAARIIESKILSYEVELERNPNNMRAKTKLEILREVYRKITDYDDPVEPSLHIVVCGRPGTIEEEYHGIVDAFSLLGCKPRLKCVDPNFLKSYNKHVVQPRSLLVGKGIEWMQYPYTVGEYLGSESIPIGFDLLLGKVVGLPLWDERGAKHTIVVGPTGKGKTTLAALTAIMATLLYDARVVAVDPKGDMWDILSWTGLVERVLLEDEHAHQRIFLASMVASKFSNILIIDLKYLSENEKYIHLESTLVSIFSMLQSMYARSVLIVDEFWRVSNSEVVKKLIREGRSSGISLVLLSQQPADFSPEVWNNSNNVVVFGSLDETYLEDVKRFSGIAYEDLIYLPRLGVGEALIRYQQSQRAFPARILPVPITVKSPSIQGTSSRGRVLRYG